MENTPHNLEESILLMERGDSEPEVLDGSLPMRRGDSELEVLDDILLVERRNSEMEVLDDILLVERRNSEGEVPDGSLFTKRGEVSEVEIIEIIGETPWQKQESHSQESREPTIIAIDDDKTPNLPPLVTVARRPKTQPATPKEEVSEFEIPMYDSEYGILRPYNTVELESGDYLRIYKISNRLVCRNSDDTIKSEIFLTGALFTRATTLRFLHNKGNEVAMVDGETRVNVKEVRGKRRLIITNAPFPEYRREGLLICRWVWVLDDDRKDEGLIRRILETESDKEYKWDNVVLRIQWRGEKLEELRLQEERRKQAALDKSMRRKEEIKNKGTYTIDLTSDPFFEGKKRSPVLTRSESVPGPNVSTHRWIASGNSNPVTPKKPSKQQVDEGYFTGGRPGKQMLDSEDEIEVTDASNHISQDVKKRGFQPSGNQSPIIIVDEDEDDMTLLRIQREDRFTTPQATQTPRASHVMDLHETEPNVPLELKVELKPESSIPPELRSLDPMPSRYTFGDAFCGAGGMSRGADMAGLVVKWGVDHDDAAIQAYQLNFPAASSYHTTVDELLMNLKECIVVDVLHLSPPCQPYSPAHTRDGKNDEFNEAALFSIDKFLEVCRPRYATAEQTFGIMRHQLLPGLLSPFLDRGFSVHYKVLHGGEYGVPQTRRRLIVLTAGPGETLPSFPKPTHYVFTPEPGLLPAPTIHDIISRIPINATDHEFRFFPVRRPPTDAHRQCKTLMAGGSDAEYHPSGLRPYTMREKACLQTFPRDHVFSGAQTKRQSQIGNAVPPILGMAILKEVIKALTRTDKNEERRQAEGREDGEAMSREQHEDDFLEIVG